MYDAITYGRNCMRTAYHLVETIVPLLKDADIDKEFYYDAIDILGGFTRSIVKTNPDMGCEEIRGKIMEYYGVENV